jgi:hypothetical protein
MRERPRTKRDGDEGARACDEGEGVCDAHHRGRAGNDTSQRRIRGERRTLPVSRYARSFSDMAPAM